MKIDLTQALVLLNNNHVVAIPTETVYGLAAKFDSLAGIEKIYEIKNRPKNHPLIIHIGQKNPEVYLEALAVDIPPYVFKLIENFWPGPMTLILKKSNFVSEKITGGQATVGIRMPNHPVALTLIDQLGCPLVAPSANKYCELSPTSLNDVESALGHDIPVLEGGRCSVGIESTIVSALNLHFVEILRPGLLTPDLLEKAAGVPCIDSRNNPTPIKTRVSGDQSVHYAPKKKLYLIRPDEIKNIKNFKKNIKNSFLIDLDQTFFLLKKEVSNYLSMPLEPNAYAALIYQYLRMADQDLLSEFILLVIPPNQPEWAGVLDRLNKAGEFLI